MVAHRACPDARVPSERRFCRVPYSLMASRLRGGANFNSMRTTTTSSLDGWSPINGRPGSSTTKNARSKPHSRTISSSCISVPAGLVATGGLTTLAFALRDMSGGECTSCFGNRLLLTTVKQSTALVYLCFAYCHLHIALLHFRPADSLVDPQGHGAMVRKHPVLCRGCPAGLDVDNQICQVAWPFYSRTSRLGFSSSLHSFWVLSWLHQTLRFGNSTHSKSRAHFPSRASQRLT
jgi:hypothetical protein